MANIPNSKEGDQIPPSPPPPHSSPNPILFQQNPRPPPPALEFFSSSKSANPASTSVGTVSIVPDDQSPRSTTSSNPSPRSARSPGRPAGQPSSGRHPVYKGIRIRSGKWVSEIREPRKTNRIWLGTYPTPEMAAAAYDVAALTLKGPETNLNFPGALVSYALPTSTSASDIQQAAAAAAASRAPKKQEEEVAKQQEEEQQQQPEPDPGMGQEEEFVDVDELLDMPNLLVDMAGGMMVSPPRIMSSPPPSDDSTSHSDAETLWSYYK